MKEIGVDQLVNHSHGLSVLGAWVPAQHPPAFDGPQQRAFIQSVRQPLSVLQDAHGQLGLGLGGQLTSDPQRDSYHLLGALPALYPEWLGDRSFQEQHGVRFAYVAGAMANGIATVEMVEAMARAGMMGFFGAAGLSFQRIEEAIDRLDASLGKDATWGANLIHSPNEPTLEAKAAELYIRRGVRRVSASAFMKLEPSIVHYAYSGLTVNAEGEIQRRHYVFAKISRPETATHFMNPAPRAMLDALVRQGRLTAEEAALAEHLPVAEDIIAEADSGGHTDNRPLTVLLPEILAVRDEITAARGYTRPIRVGAAGGLGTPRAVAAAFALGASFVLTGSVNQSAMESGLCLEGRHMLAKAGMADVIMAPAADMFELGVEVQVLKRGTMFGVRAQKLYEVYQKYASIDAIPEQERARLERRVIGAKLSDIWDETRQFWGRRDPDELQRALDDPHHQMALVFRWYLGKASRWAIVGDETRALDYQIWCGPAMGSFNRWVKGTFLEPVESRGVVQIALNLLEGAATIARAQQLRTFGLPVPPEAFQFKPRPLG